MAENNVVYRGPGFATLLTVLFVGLKLTDHIDWSWVWVLSPMWIGLGLGASCLLVAGILYLIAKWLER